MRATVIRAIDRLDEVRRFVPVAYLPRLVERKVDRLWTDDAYRESQEAQLHILLDHTDRVPEIPELARGYAAHALMRTYLRWHPRQLHHQEVRGIEWLTTRRDPDRPVVLSFMHHNWFEGMFGSLKNAGCPTITVFMSTLILQKDTPTGLKQHARISSEGSVRLPAEGGTAALEARIRPGGVYAIATDVPGHTRIQFLGKQVLGSFGAALMASHTDAQVVLVTSHRIGGAAAGPMDCYLQVHEPIESGDFAEPIDLLREIVRRHEGPVLDWPEAYLNPRSRWGTVEE